MLMLAVVKYSYSAKEYLIGRAKEKAEKYFFTFDSAQNINAHDVVLLHTGIDDVGFGIVEDTIKSTIDNMELLKASKGYIFDKVDLSLIAEKHEAKKKEEYKQLVKQHK